MMDIETSKKLLEELLAIRDAAELSSMERVERMAQIDEQIDLYTELIGDLTRTYEELEDEENKYQEAKAALKENSRNVRSIFSRKKFAKQENVDAIQLSYDISDRLNVLRAKSRRTELEEQEYQELQEKFQKVLDILDKKEQE